MQQTVIQKVLVKEKGQKPVIANSPWLESSPTPEGYVDIRVLAAAWTPLARSRASGSHYSVQDAAYPRGVGVDGVGERLDGQGRVYFILPLEPHGALAEIVRVAESNTLPLNPQLDPVQVAALANPGMASWAALRHVASLQNGETVLVHGATGVAGALAVEVARHLGAGKVIVTGRNRDALARLRADSAHTFGESGESSVKFESETALAEDMAMGVDIVLDFLWGAPTAALLRVAAEKLPRNTGRVLRLVNIGSSAGEDLPLKAAILRSAPIRLMGSGFGTVSLALLKSSIAEVLEASLSQPQTLAVPVHSVPLSSFESEWLESRPGVRLVFKP